MAAGETWRFELQDAQADRVFLVTYREGGFSTWLAMDRVGDDHWEAVTNLLPGHYHVRYFRAEGETFFNAGSAGLVGHRVTGANRRRVTDDERVTLHESVRSLEAV